MVREVNVRVIGKGLELLSANGGRSEINQLLITDDTALVADSKKKFGRLVPINFTPYMLSRQQWTFELH